MEFWSLVLLSVFRLVNVFVHSVGCHLLTIQYKRGEDTALQILLVNLSATEIIQSVLSILLTPITDLVDFDAATSEHIHVFQEYLGVLTDTAVWLVHGVNVIYIAVDRLLHIRLSLKYELVCTVQRGKRLIQATWSVASLVYILIVSLYACGMFDYHGYLGYWYISFDLVFLVVALYMYMCIFHTYVKSKQHPMLNQIALSSASSHTYLSRFGIFRNSRFYVVALRITNFIMLKISADILFFVLGVISGNHDDVITHVPSMMIAFVMWALSDTVDAYVYIFEERSVRKLLRTLLVEGRKRCRSEVIKVKQSILTKNSRLVSLQNELRLSQRMSRVTQSSRETAVGVLVETSPIL